jgi:small-conductance mechanosensitive channel
MNIKKNKNAELTSGVKTLIIGIVGIVVILLVLSALVPVLYSGVNNMTKTCYGTSYGCNESNYASLPLASLFTTIVPILVVVAILIGVFIIALNLYKKGKGK